MRAAIACALALAAGLVQASGTHTLTIGTTIISNGNCRFLTPGPTSMNFGNIDPSSTMNATATVDIPFRCNGGPSSMTTWFVSTNYGQYETGPGAPRMRHAVDTTQFLPYTLNLPASGSIPKNSSSLLTVVGTIQVADFADARAGLYTDSVVLTMTP